jgi:hypothetical protein
MAIPLAGSQPQLTLAVLARLGVSPGGNMMSPADNLSASVDGWASTDASSFVYGIAPGASGFPDPHLNKTTVICGASSTSVERYMDNAVFKAGVLYWLYFVVGLDDPTALWVKFGNTGYDEALYSSNPTGRKLQNLSADGWVVVAAAWRPQADVDGSLVICQLGAYDASGQGFWIERAGVVASESAPTIPWLRAGDADGVVSLLAPHLYDPAADTMANAAPSGAGGMVAGAMYANEWVANLVLRGTIGGTGHADEMGVHILPRRSAVYLVRAHMPDGPTGDHTSVDVVADGVTIFGSTTDMPRFDDGAGGGVRESQLPTQYNDGPGAWAAGSVLSVYIRNIGSGYSGGNLTVSIHGRYLG